MRMEMMEPMMEQATAYLFFLSFFPFFLGSSSPQLIPTPESF